MTNHDDLCENLPRYMFHIDDAGRASMKQDPIGAYIHIADLKQALKLSGSCEGMTEKLRMEHAVMLATLQQIWIWAKEYPEQFKLKCNQTKILEECDKFFHAQMTGGKER